MPNFACPAEEIDNHDDYPLDSSIDDQAEPLTEGLRLAVLWRIFVAVARLIGRRVLVAVMLACMPPQMYAAGRAPVRWCRW